MSPLVGSTFLRFAGQSITPLAVPSPSTHGISYVNSQIRRFQFARWSTIFGAHREDRRWSIKETLLRQNLDLDRHPVQNHRMCTLKSAYSDWHGSNYQLRPFQACLLRNISSNSGIIRLFTEVNEALGNAGSDQKEQASKKKASEIYQSAQAMNHSRNDERSTSTPVPGGIDPITNRRVSNNASFEPEGTRDATPVPVKKFKGYRSELTEKPGETGSGSTPGNKNQTINVPRKPKNGAVNPACGPKVLGHKYVQQSRHASEGVHQPMIDKAHKYPAHMSTRLKTSFSAVTATCVVEGHDKAIQKTQWQRPSRSNLETEEIYRPPSSDVPSYSAVGNLKQRKSSPCHQSLFVSMKDEDAAKHCRKSRRQELEDQFDEVHQRDALDIKYLKDIQKRKVFVSETKCVSDKNFLPINSAKSKLNEPQNSDSAALYSKKLTGSYVRDFPEEFEKTWTSRGSSGSLIADNASNLFSTARESQIRPERDVPKPERDCKEGLVSHSASSKKPLALRLQTSLDRQDKSLLEKESSSAPMPTTENSDPTTVTKTLAQTSTAEKELALHKARKEEEKKVVQEIRGIYEEKYGTIDCSHRQVPEANRSDKLVSSQEPVSTPISSSSLSSDEAIKPLPVHSPDKLVSSQDPTSNPLSSLASNSSNETTNRPPVLYKILVYDPTMQVIPTATTTSTVPDVSTPLLPAEVLLRLSNPAKFFPYFAPLRTEGFEIVSGAGDVLIFHKVRDAITTSPLPTPHSPEARTKTTLQPGTTASATTTAQKNPPYPPNPIDGTTSYPQHLPSVTGNFASPTGFVNHDRVVLLAERSSMNEIQKEDKDAAAGFKSNVDVRREEEVFSGRSSWKHGEGQMGRNKGRGMESLANKFLVGAISVGAFSYVFGWVVEHF